MKMNKAGTVLLAALICVTGMTGFLVQGCSSGPADGKLQIMFSGNIRGNVAPCG
ncbi:hypothetical protein KKC97_12950 [bacterium]|nr:hypothetical protein [bacterium]MBU1638565.1 hypothetical protein [bacterium]MBU1920087.1 hypothetical protein [bacterium]